MNLFTKTRFEWKPKVCEQKIYLFSASLHWASYNFDTQTLALKFRSGSLYRYERVPKPIYQGLLKAFSKGLFFHRYIYNCYPFEKIRA